MRIVTLFTKGLQRDLLTNMLGSLRRSGVPLAGLRAFLCNQPEGSYGSEGFRGLTRIKLDVIIRALREEPEGGMLLFMDNDIVVFRDFREHLAGFSGDFVMQDDLWAPCTGFFLVRKSDPVISFFLQCLHWMDANSQWHDGKAADDQHAFLATWGRQSGPKAVTGDERLRLRLLPRDVYPNGKIYYENRIREKAVLVHGNYLWNSRSKIKRFRKYKQWHLDESVWSEVGVESV
jgi:hypothetical protein